MFNKFTIVIFCVLLLALASLAEATNPDKKSDPVLPTPSPTAAPPVLQDDKCAEVAKEQPKPKVRDNKTIPAATIPTPEDEEAIKVQTNLVTVPLSVMDRAGRVALGLRQQHFEVYEDGVPQKIEYFQAVEQPFTVFLLIDVSPSTKLRFEQIKSEAISFVNKLRPEDRIGVVLFDRSVRVLTGPTGDRATLLKAIDSVNEGSGTSLYDAVDMVLNRELPRIHGRKAVVLLTDGVDTTSSHASYESTLRDLAESDALFYTVRYDTSRDVDLDAIGLNAANTKVKGTGDTRAAERTPPPGPAAGGNPAQYHKGRRYIELLAEMTGGREFEAGPNYLVGPAFSGVADELRRQYTLGYYPNSPSQPGERKQIKIKLKLPDAVAREAVVRAKPCYRVAATRETTR